MPMVLPMVLPMDMSNEYQSIFDANGRMAYERRFKIHNGQNAFVRIENAADPILQECNTPQHVFDMISTIRSQQGRYGNSNLYDRSWIAKTTKRKLTVESSYTKEIKSSFSISVAQFNALAEGLSAGKCVKTPFPVDGENTFGEFGGFTSIPNPEVTLDYQQRKWRILEAILGQSTDSARMFDVVAIQEMDRFYGFFEPLLNIFGYDGLFIPKSNSPGIRLGWFSDGCCLFWKRDQFQLISHTDRYYSVGGSQVFLIVCLKHTATQQPLIFATTHLKSKRSEANEEIRQRQAIELLDYLEKEEIKYVSSLRLQSKASIPIFVLGDFNADPPLENNLSISSIETVLQHKTNTASLNYSSAYEIENPNSSFFTTWKIRENVASRRIIDYIFFRGGNVRCVATLQVPTAKEIEMTRLPGSRYPSDHMLLGAQFQINREVSEN
jgi:mRNA deadenylase 3'-5' endonuclease subunit Ccr4